MDHFDKEKKKRFIDGVWRDESKVVAYCSSELHHRCLTCRQMETHQCEKKECKNFWIENSAEYWKRKEEKRIEKQKHREEKKATKKLEEDILNYANETVKDMPDISFVKLRIHPQGFYYLFYASDKYVDLTEPVAKIRIKFHIRVFLRKMYKKIT